MFAFTSDALIFVNISQTELIDSAENCGGKIFCKLNYFLTHTIRITHRASPRISLSVTQHSNKLVYPLFNSCVLAAGAGDPRRQPPEDSGAKISKDGATNGCVAAAYTAARP